MLAVDELTVIHHDDTETKYTNVGYRLDRAGVRVFTTDGDRAHAAFDVLRIESSRDRKPA